MPRNQSSILRTSTSRRGFLRGAAIATAGVAGIATLGKLETASAAGPVRIQHPPVEVVKVQPFQSGVYLAERVGAGHALTTDLWRPTGHIWLKNTSGSAVTLSGMRVSYIGAGAPGPKEMLQLVEIPAGGTKAVPIAEDRLHPLPVAPIIKIECFFQGYTPPVVYNSFLLEYKNDEPGDAYDFPGKTSDLDTNMYWSSGTNHGWDSKHGNTRSQRFAYDLHVRRYDGSGWTRMRAKKYPTEVVDGSKNDHSNIWGTPVYAVRAGYVVSAYRLRPDNSAPGVKDSPGGGGNAFWIKHEAGDDATGGFMLYAHLMAGSVPPYLVPKEGEDCGVQVQKGEFLGLAGNSGSSSGPHLHLHFQRGWDSKAEGMPLRFKNARYRRYENFDPGADFLWWNSNYSHAAVPEKCLIDAVGPATGPVLNPNVQMNGGGQFTIGR